MHRASSGVEPVTGLRAVGIDLGASALHAVVVEGSGRRAAVVATAVVLPAEEEALTELCAGAAALAIDAPSDPSTAIHVEDEAVSRKFRVARCGEIALGEQRRCWVPWVTPRSVDVAPSWIQVGFRAWEVARAAGHDPLEVYPSGAFTALAGRRLAKKSGALGVRERLEVLDQHVALPDHAAMWSHDAVDATVAALVAVWHATDGPVTAARHEHEGEDGSAIWMPA